MNASVSTYSDAEFDYVSEFNYSDKSDRPQRKNQISYGRRPGKQPRSYNGIHRRRARRIKW